MKRFALILTVLALLLLCACSQSGSSNVETYENAYGGYKFNIERDWEYIDLMQGIPAYGQDVYIAYQSPADKNGVSAAVVTVETIEGDVADYVINSLDEASKELKITDRKTSDISLGGAPARRVEYNIEVAGVKKSACLVCCAHDGYTYVVRFYANDGTYSTYLPVYEAALSSFEFTPRTAPETASAPDYSGGTLESADGDYSFVCPAGWGVIKNDGMPVVAPKDAGVSVSVTAFSLPDEKLSYGAYDYWKEYAEELRSVLDGFTVTKEYEKEDEPKLGGVVAARKEYSATLDGAVYKYIQVICIRNGYVYSVLFTSDAAEYDTYAPAFDGIVSSFRFN